MVGPRDAEWANAFIEDLACRLKDRVQLTSDGLKVYLNAVEEAFDGDVDYATLVKVYGKAPEDEFSRRYSPSEVTGCQLAVIQGSPDPRHISTS